MKFLLLFVVSFFCVSSFATIRTVSNNPSTIAQFSNIQTAIDASADGDTVYVHGSPIVYADFNIIDKKIAVIGPGRAPDTELQYSATCNFITLDNTNNPGSANGSEVNGLQINFSIVIYAVDNIRIIRCSLGGEFGITANRTISSLLLESCIIKGMTFNSLATYTNMLVQNCIIYNYIPVSLINISGLTNSVNVRFNHNLFYGSGPVATGGHDMFSNNCRNIIFTNNIFTRCNPGPNLSFSSFSNNITYNCGSGNDPWLINSNTNGGGNISNQNPQMADQAAVDAAVFSGLLNFTISAGPANNSGDDGKDIGLLYDATGSLNWANSRNSRFPRIFKMKIINPTVASGGNVTVNIEAKTSN